MQGIWRFEIDSKMYTRLAPFYYGETPERPGLGVNLAAFEDRIQIQGSDYFEYDLIPFRLLRRYDDVSGLSTPFAFHGTLITADQARRAGVKPGIYGFRICAAGQFSLPDCPTADFSLLYRRDADPAANRIEPVKALQSFGDPAVEQTRFVAYDEKRSHLWLWSEGAEGFSGQTQVSRLSTLELTALGVGDERLQAETKRSTTSSQQETLRLPLAFTYNSGEDSFLHSYYHYLVAPLYSLVRRSVSSGAEEVLIEDRHPEIPKTPVAIATLPRLLPLRWVQTIPAVGAGPGANNTYWRSDLWLYNPSEEESAVSIRRVAHPEQRREYVLSPHGSLKIADVLTTMGGGPVERGGDGVVTDALVIEAPYRWGEQLVAYSRTYTSEPGQSGTYGQAVPAVPSNTGYSTHLPTFESPYDRDPFYNTYPEFILDKREPDRYRHNLGIVNDSPEVIEVSLRYGARGFSDPSEAARATLSVPPHSVRNVNLEGLFSREVLTTRGPRVWIAASRPAPVWLSMVDNQSGDATFVPFNTFGIRADEQTRLAIPAVAHTPGANGTFWRTDLYGYFPPVDFGKEPQQEPLAFFHPAASGTCVGNEVQQKLRGLAGPEQPGQSWDPYWHSVFPDVVRQFSQCPNDAGLAGALEMRLASWMSGYSRTYTTRESDGATFGEILPFYPAGGWPVQHFSGIEMHSQFRVNLGLYNGLERPVEHKLLLYDARGQLANQRIVTLTAKESRQFTISALFGELPAGLYGLSIIPLDNANGPGRSWAYVSLVDNLTGDPTNFW